jgi:hypothetical protein
MMKRSNPATVVGGGEMNRLTSSALRICRSDGASESRNSRSMSVPASRTGRPFRQFVVVTVGAGDAIETIPGAVRITLSIEQEDCRNGVE